MKLRKILAAAMALTVICGAQTALTSYQPAEGITANAKYYKEVTVGGIEYHVYDDHAVVVGHSDIKGDVIIPSVVDGALVTSIGSGALSGCTEMTSITIPDSVTSIENYAFYSCSGMTSVIISDSVINIGEDAFYSCSGLTSVTLPNSVTNVGKFAFGGCTELTSITIPASVTKIDGGAFGGTPWLEAKKQENPIVVVNNIVIDGHACEGDITIPDGVTNIVESAFSSCSRLTSITVPASVTYIGKNALYKCDNVTVYGYQGSFAESYAKEYNKPFVAIEKATTTTAPETTTEPVTTTVTTPAKEVSFGDPTGDGKIDANDASFVLVEYAKVSTGGESALTPEETAAADVNKDGKVDAKDASAILAYYSYLSTGGTDTLEAFLKPQEL